MINVKRILKRLPEYDNPNPATAKAEQQEVLDKIATAIQTGEYDFTSRRSLRIYYAVPFESDGIEVKWIEVEWKINQ